MIDRRDLFKGLAVGAMVAASSPANACQPMSYGPDPWGEKLVKYFETGDTIHLEGVFAQNATFMAFAFEMAGRRLNEILVGPEKIISGLSDLRKRDLEEIGGWSRTKFVHLATVSDGAKSGIPNKMQFGFKASEIIRTSCGPNDGRSEYELHYFARDHGYSRMEPAKPIESLLLMRLR